ncbi:hypothetical protein EGI26_19000 [Lacihabitans sp. CCS-44]|uniref:hypothetical protein n=1 Tax=Lacihabitans sp. CCS-44 TaxID=2487331 RepID=UPI0020CB8520|nr:hypothetical protein [Lacihabitans sp. CCS-44]MCP9757253.1 hypothetical protein [Lacihabitans sp. CCS-44]
MSKPRINIPSNVQEVIEMAEIINNRHVADGETSPLNALQDHKLADIGPLLTACLQQHLKAEELRRQMELAYRERDAMVKPISETIKACRDLLLGVFRANPKKLGEWGFKVSDSPSKAISRLKTSSKTEAAV